MDSELTVDDMMKAVKEMTDLVDKQAKDLAKEAFDYIENLDYCKVEKPWRVIMPASARPTWWKNYHSDMTRLYFSSLVDDVIVMKHKSVELTMEMRYSFDVIDG